MQLASANSYFRPFTITDVIGAEIAGTWPPAWVAYLSGYLKAAGFTEITFIDAMTEQLDVCPLLLGVGLSDTRRFPHALNTHVMLELGLAFLDEPAHRRGG